MSLTVLLVSIRYQAMEWIMYFIWTLVAVCLGVAFADHGLAGSIAQALGFALVVGIAFANGGKASKKSSDWFLSRVKPSHYDKVL
ncbi:hypothetical protein [Vibrio ezurae]|uniref:Uncharacterized protein n=1 Tax=Vibrio ezurae NBRC 102218 TaxID=1219080 RepID=U3CQF8_9VIBR|nr:hypothetical protein [Vibrio ezurae]GAD80333.1 hypothetical protein VEZ01S_33_00350 [Vibrio ezurae NBRC 102218]